MNTAQMDDARRRVAAMDKIDGGVSKLPERLFLGTVHAALECAVNKGEWDIACDALAMIEQRIMWNMK